MKKPLSIFAGVVMTLGLIFNLHGQTVAGGGQTAQPLPAPTPYAVVSRDADSQVWERTTYERAPDGTVVARKSHYTEISSGLNFKDSATGQWKPSQEEIDILPQGGGSATQGQHQSYFPSDIFQGVIKDVTPDGVQLQSRPLALGYFDGTTTIFIGVLTNSIGVLVSPNQVLYPNAFVGAGVDADLMYTYTKAGLEQDVILRAQPPVPEAFGLISRNSRLQVMTEFFNAPQPKVTASAAGSLPDQNLDFGVTEMVPGKAFLMGTNSPTVPVGKQWVNLEGRQFLIEEIPIAGVAAALDSLPMPTALNKQTPLPMASKELVLPPQRLAGTVQPSKPMQLAKSSLPTHGLVLDYVTLNGSTNRNYTFQGDTTYYISGSFYWFNSSGIFTIEGGAVLKYGNSGQVYVYGSLVSTAGPYRMAVLTSMNDNSVGETISGSTGHPTSTVATYLNLPLASTPSTLAYLRIAYAGTGIYQSMSSGSINVNPIWNCQFVNCTVAISDASYHQVAPAIQALYNVLFANDSTAVLDGEFTYYGPPYAGEIYIVGQNVTADKVTFLLQTGSDDGYYWDSVLTNSILTGVSYQVYFKDNYGTASMGLSDCDTAGSGSGIYQTNGAGHYYLANGSTNRNAGTTNIDPALLAQLRQKTTWPPLVYSNVLVTTNLPLSPQAARDSAVPGPDLGYHYDPVDYAFGGVVMSNAAVTLAPGTVLGVFGDNTANYGLSIGTGGQMICDGSADNLNHIVTYNTVQEEPGTNVWQTPANASVTDFVGGPGGVFDIRFTDWSMITPPDGVCHLNISYDPVNLRDCQFHGGMINTWVPNLNLTNCLLERVNVELTTEASGTNWVCNNLFYGGVFQMFPIYGWSQGVVENNLFDRTLIYNDSPDTIYTANNAYVTNYSRLEPTSPGDVILTNSPAYQTGPLGNYYEPASSRLIDAGSITAAAAGLTTYTILTNQTPDGGNVDIGYHYQLTGTGAPGSTGTDFWLAFFDLPAGWYEWNSPFLNLYISSPVTASGTVSAPGVWVDGPTLIVTNCGDATVNGTYVLTNVTAQEEEMLQISYYYEPELDITSEYAYGTNHVFFDGLKWNLIGYNSVSDTFVPLYQKDDPLINLNGNDWDNTIFEPNSPPTTVCVQVLFSQSFSVAAGTVTNIAIPLATMITDYDEVETNGIHVTSSQPVSVYGVDYAHVVSTAFTAYPTPMLGTNYCLMARESANSSGSCYSQLAIVGTADSTTVTITPSTNANLSHAGIITTNLNQGQTYQINSSDYTGDVTGTWVTSSKPVAVFAGANEANVPDDYGNSNPLLQEQLPVEDWGTNVVAMAFDGRLNGDTYRVLAVNDDTVVNITTTNGTTVITNQAGQFYETNGLGGPVEFQANQPIQVAHFANGDGFDGQEGDPCEILLPSAGHWQNAYTIYASPDPVSDPSQSYYPHGFDTNYVNLIVAQSGISTTLLDGIPVAATNFIEIGTNGYYGAQISVTNGVHTVNSAQPIEVQVYGWGDDDAYGYFGGIVNFP